MVLNIFAEDFRGFRWEGSIAKLRDIKKVSDPIIESRRLTLGGLSKRDVELTIL